MNVQALALSLLNRQANPDYAPIVQVRGAGHEWMCFGAGLHPLRYLHIPARAPPQTHPTSRQPDKHTPLAMPFSTCSQKLAAYMGQLGNNGNIDYSSGGYSLMMVYRPGPLVSLTSSESSESMSLEP